MTSTLLQQQSNTTTAKATTATTTTTTATASAAMAWSNEKLRFSCADNISLKQLWKLIALDATRTNNKQQQQQQLQQQQPTQRKQSKRNADKSNEQQQQTKLDKNLQQKQQQQIKNNNNNEQNLFEHCENLAEYLNNRNGLLPHSRMSLLKFLAINALELSAPATPALLQQQPQYSNSSTLTSNSNANTNVKPQGWVQLSGHPESIVPTSTGIVRKRVANFNDSEVQAYQQIAQESQTADIVPHYYGTLHDNGENFIELQDLLAGFKDPCVMDIKMGCRTFLETEVSNTTLRPDLYRKMLAVDPNAPTADEHTSQAITKLRYMLFREALSSSQTKGFRIEALRLRGRAPIKDLKTVQTSEQITQTILQFLTGAQHGMHKALVQRLKQMRAIIEQSLFFARHEIVGSSIFIVYDEQNVGAWLIDFVKSRALPLDINVSHRSDWIPGNREEGLLKGMDELINAFESVTQSSSASSTRTCNRRCLQI